MAGRRNRDQTAKDLADPGAAHAPALHFRAEAPPMPGYVAEDENLKKVWIEVVTDFDRIKILARTDTGTIEAYCICLDQMRRMRAFLTKNGETYESKTPTGTRYYKRPECDLLKESLLRLKSYLTELGASPASRPKVPSGLQADLFEKGEGSKNQWAEYDKGLRPPAH